ncbi:MAG: hypothetical protein HYR55_09110 [Acidobacteria bacterium]|nr:hypothetical protein [Acidobacteriota bacterium]
MSRKLFIYIVVASFTIFSGIAQVIPHKAVFYRPAHAAFVAELADDTPPTPFGGPTPREQAIQTLDQNFGLIAQNLHANRIVIALSDDDSWQSQFGGGWSYDPVARPKPQTGVAQEIILSIANKWGLKVIFALGFFRATTSG